MIENYTCKNCELKFVERKTYTPGTMGMELVLWLCFVFPGLVYSAWRLSARYDGCPRCSSKNLKPHYNYDKDNQ